MYYYSYKEFKIQRKEFIKFKVEEDYMNSKRYILALLRIKEIQLPKIKGKSNSNQLKDKEDIRIYIVISLIKKNQRILDS